MYKVFIHNDNQSTFDLVIQVLVQIFSKEPQKAKLIAQETHEKGISFVGAYTFEQAEFRVEQAHSLARGRGFPLKLTFEPE